jgi:hypothetical protein
MPENTPLSGYLESGGRGTKFCRWPGRVSLVSTNKISGPVQVDRAAVVDQTFL